MPTVTALDPAYQKYYSRSVPDSKSISGGIKVDFSLEYTEEQEEFAREVREWLEENVPQDLVYIRDAQKMSYEQLQELVESLKEIKAN